MKKTDVALYGFCGVLILVLLALSAYNMIAFYTYPCDAYKSGYLSIGYAPARCIQ